MTPANLMKAYEEALASQNWANVAPLLHPNVCVTFSSGTFKGKENVRQVFEKNFELIKDEKYSISNMHWVIEQGMAICLYIFSWSGLMNGQPASGQGRGTSVLIEADGVWQIIAEHLGPNAS